MKKALSITLAALFLIAAVVYTGGCGGGSAPAANNAGAKPKPTTTPHIVTAPEMDDEDCVKEVEVGIVKVAGVDVVECDMAKRTVRVYPKQGAQVSPKALWEAFEALPFDGTKEPKVTKIDGPSGVFTAKPDK